MTAEEQRAQIIVDLEEVLARLRKGENLSLLMAYDAIGGAQVMIFGRLEEASLMVMTALEAVQSGIKSARRDVVISHEEKSN